MGLIELLIIILIVALLASLINREGWGPWPGGIVGTILLVVVLLWLLGRL